MEHSTARSWRERYAEKRVTAEQAVRCVGRGQRVFVGSGAAEPQALVAALTARAEELADTEILHILTLGIAPYSEARYGDAFRHNALFIGPNVRSAVAEGRADYTPVFLSEIPRLLRSGRMPIDVALIQVSPPDAHGFCSYGVSVDVVKAGAESAELVIAEVNPRMPRTLGDSFLHVSRIAWLVENDAPLLESQPAPPDEVAIAIGRQVAELVEDGSTLQLGIGAIPNAVLHQLQGKRDLGVHTEMLSDGVIDLIESGVITCSRKTLLPGKVVTSFCMGSRRLYDYVHDNPRFEFRPTEFTNDPGTIARNARMVAVNSAIEVDLTGQVCSDSMGSRFYSGIGGQVDFIRGAARSEGGKPIIVLRSTAKGGTVSRIVPQLRDGAGVVTTRGDVHYVVTEYGVADLWGKSVRERAMALISIAHPQFREELLRAAKERSLVYPDQILRAAEYPVEWVRTVRLRGGEAIRLRPARPTDEPLLKELFYDSSEETLYHRYFRLIRTAPHAMLQQVVNPDYETEMAVVATDQIDDRERLLAVGRYVVDPATRLADVAFMVLDPFQGKGIGTELLRYLMEIAKTAGLQGFTADVLADNLRMLHVFHKSGRPLRTTLAEGVYHLELRFAENGSESGSSATPNSGNTTS
ncbi:MAG: GNAT family N-acetyltransferase [Armatimonadota bacterium]